MTQRTSQLGASVDGLRRSSAKPQRRRLRLLTIVVTIVACAGVVSAARGRVRFGGHTLFGSDRQVTNASNAQPRFVRVEDLPRVGFVRVDDLDRVLSPVRPVQGTELTPDLIHRAEYVLRKEEKPLGTQVVVESGDRKYIARFEWHYHDDLVPDHVQGWHKGVTIYTTE